MLKNEETKLPSTIELEVGGMAELLCAYCGSMRPLAHNYGAGSGTYQWADKEEIQGLLICGQCGKRTVFAMTGNFISFYPGKFLEEELDAGLSEGVVACFEDALLSFYGRAYRSSVAMCRSALEEALDSKGISGKDLYAKIQQAEKIKILGTEEISQAQAARLIGRNALHRGMPVTKNQSLLALTSTLHLVNHLVTASV
jgi:hypothetical protein